MNLVLIGSLTDTYTRMVYQWFVSNEIKAQYIETEESAEDLEVEALPVVILNGNIYCTGYDLAALEKLKYM